MYLYLKKIENFFLYRLNRIELLKLKISSIFVTKMDSASNGIILNGNVVTVASEIYPDVVDGCRVARGNVLYQSLREAVEKAVKQFGCKIVLQLFSGGSAFSPKKRKTVIECVKEDLIKTVALSGTELSKKQMIAFATQVIEAGGRFVWFSGGSDQYAVKDMGLSAEGNFKVVTPSTLNVCEPVDPDLVFEPEEGADWTDREVYVAHNFGLESAPSLIEHITTLTDFAVIHFVSQADTAAITEGRYGDLQFSHAGIGGIAVGHVLVGGLDSGDPDHAPTLKWIENAPIAPVRPPTLGRSMSARMAPPSYYE